jgi:hypothetical protein
MSIRQENQEHIYRKYLASLSVYSRCIQPVVHASMERNEGFYKVMANVNLEKYCVYEKNEVVKYRDLLNQNSAN